VKRPLNSKDAPFTFSGKNFSSVSSDLTDEYTIVQRNTTQHSIASQFSFTNIDTNTSAKRGFGRDNYEWFREKETVPKKRADLIQFCQVAYERFGIVHNVIDLMADFGCQGIKLVHPIKRVEKVYREWARAVKMKERSERFLNLLYRLGIVSIQRSTAKLRKRDIDRLYSAVGKADIEVESPPDIEKNEIPWRYTFLNPLSIDVLGGELASYTDKQIYGLRLTERVKRQIINPTNDVEREIVKNLPKSILEAARSNLMIVPLPQDKVFFYHYKKDDWNAFGSPMIAPILSDIIMLEKLKLTDISACDSAISTVRLWRLGDLEHKILPTPAAISRLATMLTNNTGGGSFDLIWGPELDFKESDSKIHQFLGEAKYKPTLNAIFAGLGIPPTLTGEASQGGFTNNFISLKTLIERLEYGRSILRMFWEQEIRAFQKALGLRVPAQLHFDRMTLSDESAEKRLLLDLIDRDLVSADTVLERFNELPDIERQRIQKDYKLRYKEKMPEKAGPYHNADALDDFKKIFAQQGILTPSEVGIELEERKPGEIPHIEQQAKLGLKNKAKKGVSGEGRPLMSKDSRKRKQKVVKPRGSSKAALYNTYNWSKSSLDKISDIVTPLLLKYYKKTNARQLTNIEANIVEETKFGILTNIKPYTEINEEVIQTALSAKAKVPDKTNRVYNNLVGEFIKDYQRQPTMEESRGLQAYSYSLGVLYDG